MEALIKAHYATITDLYTKLTPNPSPLIESSISELSAQLDSLLAAQRSSIEAKLAEVEAQLDKSWTQVAEWREALGDPSKDGRTELPLESEVERVEGVLGGMRGRMRERGEKVVEVQTKLAELKEWIEVGVELEDVSDGWEKLDLRMSRLEGLQKELGRCEAELAHRRDLLNAHTSEIFALRNELGINHTITTDPATLPPGSALSSPSAPHNPSGATFPLPDTFDADILAHLGVALADDGAALEVKPTPLAPTTAVLAQVEAKRAWLESEKDHRNGLIQTTYDQLYPLWTLLGVTEAEMEDFVNAWMGSTADVVAAYRAELARMLVLKRSNLSAFIQKERQALTTLWDALYLSFPARVESFPAFSINVSPTPCPVTGAELPNDNVSEELLLAHERERERLEADVAAMGPVLERLRKYFDVVEEMRELEASAADPNRLLGKATRGDPGRLLREEKARKRVKLQKPKLENELRSLIPQWEAEHGRPLLVNGARFLDELDRAQEAEAAEKENKRRTKLGASATSRDAVVPLRAQKTGSSAASSAAPLKRQMTGGSTASSALSAASRAPLAKRQVPTHTGSTTRSIATPAASAVKARPVSRAATHEQPVKVARPLVPQVTGGMRLPAGWGGVSTAH